MNRSAPLRQPPPVFGLGLLEAVPEETILGLANPEDSDGDGISGRASRVWDATTGETYVLGRFGHKANTPNVVHQSAGAYAEAARERFRTMSKSDREALIAFLRSL